MARTGRPTRLNDTIRVGRETTTLREAILSSVRNGVDYDVSCARAQVPRTTMQQWVVLANRVAERLLLNPDAPCTDHELELVEFAAEVEAAIAEAEVRFATLMASIATGGRERTIVTVKVAVDKQGREVELERTTRNEVTLPSFQAAKWIMENRFGRRAATRVIVSQGDGLSIDERAALMVEDLERWKAEQQGDEDHADSPAAG